MRRPPPRAERGAALLLAMVIVTLVATLAAGMVWQQWRAIEVESAERARVQSAWLLDGALDWARLILREDAREGGSDALTEPWATGLAEIRLSTFLSAGQENTTDTDLDAFLSGDISDAQGRYNLQNLATDDAKLFQAGQAILARLCDLLGLPSSVASVIAEDMQAASDAQDLADEGQKIQAGAPLRIQRIDQLRWLGLDGATVEKLKPYLVILPQRTPVNINTAPPEVLMAAIDGLDRASAQRLVQQRQTLKKGFEQLSAAQSLLGQKVKLEAQHVGTNSSYFLVTGQLRYEDSVQREVSLVQRRGLNVRVLWRQRVPVL